MAQNLYGNQFIQDLLSSRDKALSIGARFSGLDEWLPTNEAASPDGASLLPNPGFDAVVIEEAPPPRDLADAQAELRQVEAELLVAEAQLSQRKSIRAMTESSASELGSDASFMTSDAEAAEIAQAEKLLRQTQKQCTALREQLRQLEAEVAVLAEQIRNDQLHADSFGEIIPTAEKLDTDRNIQYMTNFGIDKKDVYNPDSSFEDRDHDIKAILDKKWNNSGGDPDGVDYENCCIYVLHTLEEAGYDLDAQVEVNGAMVTARRLVLIHAETLLVDREDSLSAIAQDPEHRYHAVLKGVVTALTETNQGEEITDVHAIRPGDLLQWWTASNAGHTVIVHQVRTSAGVLNGASDAGDPALQAGLSVDAVSVLGSHSSHRSFNQGQQRRGQEADTSETGRDLYGKEDHVYATDFIELSEDHTGRIPYFSGDDGRLVNWWVVRPTGSDWGRPALPALP